MSSINFLTTNFTIIDSETNSIEEDEKIDDILENITMRHPRSPFILFVIDKLEKNKKEKGINKSKPLNFKDFSLEWRQLKDNEKCIYNMTPPDIKKSLHAKVADYYENLLKKNIMNHGRLLIST